MRDLHPAHRARPLTRLLAFAEIMMYAIAQKEQLGFDVRRNTNYRCYTCR